MSRSIPVFLLVLISLFSLHANADSYESTIETFRNAGQSSEYFPGSYGYAVFPSIGKGGFVVGGSYGTGRVYAQGGYVGDASVVEMTLGWQAGGQVFSQIIFFEDQRSFDEFTSGNFEFSAGAEVVAITAGASANVGTTGVNAGASGGRNDATTISPGYHKGLAVFSIAKGGLMYEASVGGQKFGYKPRELASAQ
ncbi:MAG: lipid-binding SYLF domain-containing protein [Proteobacteria bacterium]|nr:lipid-binding SYLF domain-containing protein [Pseudomonadota bacterium]